MDKIKISRLVEKLPALENNVGKLIVNNSNDISYIDKTKISNLMYIDNTVNSFKITAINGTTITITNGSVLSQNNKMINFTGGTFDVSKSINDGGTADKITERLWNQPILTSNISNNCEASASDITSTTYDAWKAFNGTNSSESDAWASLNNTAYPHWLQIKIPFPVRVEKFVIQNRNEATSCGIVFDILASQDGINWDTLVSVNNKDIVPNTAANAINEYQARETLKEYSYFRYNGLLSNRAAGLIGISRFIIVAYYHDYRIPSQYYNIFAIGNDNGESKILTSIDEIPTLPDGYTEFAKMGFFNVNNMNITNYYYPTLTLTEAFSHGNVIAESLETIGYRIYSDGWKIQWGNNANPTFPVAFTNIPQIVERDATNVTTTGMTITARNWKVEGY